MEPKVLAQTIVKILDEKKGEDIKLIQTTEVTIVSDYFIIASGTSNTHVKSLANDVEDEMSKLGVEPNHIEGRATGWVLIDYGTVIVHVFQPESRAYYNLERLWADANIEDISDIIDPEI